MGRCSLQALLLCHVHSEPLRKIPRDPASQFLKNTSGQPCVRLLDVASLMALICSLNKAVLLQTQVGGYHLRLFVNAIKRVETSLDYGPQRL